MRVCLVKGDIFFVFFNCSIQRNVIHHKNVLMAFFMRGVYLFIYFQVIFGLWFQADDI